MRGGDDNSIENYMEVKQLEMEIEVKQLESCDREAALCDRLLVIGDYVTCEKFPGAVMHIAHFSDDGTMALCLSGTEIFEYIPLNELALKNHEGISGA
jgi:hypothetical protein